MTLSASHYAQEDSTSVSSDVKLEKLDPSNVSSQSVNCRTWPDLCKHNGLVLCKADAPIKGKGIVSTV